MVWIDDGDQMQDQEPDYFEDDDAKSCGCSDGIVLRTFEHKNC